MMTLQQNHLQHCRGRGFTDLFRTILHAGPNLLMHTLEVFEFRRYHPFSYIQAENIQDTGVSLGQRVIHRGQRTLKLLHKGFSGDTMHTTTTTSGPNVLYPTPFVQQLRASTKPQCPPSMLVRPPPLARATLRYQNLTE